MTDLSEYIKDKDNLEFLEEIREALGPNSLTEIALSYKGKKFSIEPANCKYYVFGFGEPIAFDTVDDVFFKLLFEGKPFIDCLDDIDTDC